MCLDWTLCDTTSHGILPTSIVYSKLWEYPRNNFQLSNLVEVEILLLGMPQLNICVRVCSEIALVMRLGSNEAQRLSGIDVNILVSFYLFCGGRIFVGLPHTCSGLSVIFSECHCYRTHPETKTQGSMPGVLPSRSVTGV